MAFYATEKEIFEKTTKEKEKTLVTCIFSFSKIVYFQMKNVHYFTCV